MKELVVVRHGQAAYVEAGLTGGWTDKPLTELGRKQAELTGIRLAELYSGRDCRIYVSNLIRAAETAEAIGSAMGIVPTATPELRELNNGAAANLPTDEAEKLELPVTYPVADWIPYPGAESWRMMTERVWTFLDSIADEAEVAIIVSHGDACIAVIHWWLGLGEEFWSKISYELDPCSITRLTINKWNEKTITKLNDTAHLAQIE